MVAYEWLRDRPHVWLALLTGLVILVHWWKTIGDWPKDPFAVAKCYIALCGAYGGVCLFWENHTDLCRSVASVAGTAWCVSAAWRALRGGSA